MLALLVTLVGVAIAVVVIGAPMFRSVDQSPEDASAAAESEGITSDAAKLQERELAALRDAKLREIRDAELDWRTGKLNEADWQTLDAALRAEAAELLKCDSEAV